MIWPFTPARSRQANMDDGGWQPIATAPRDGTVIETKCDYGVMPWYGLHRFVDGMWQDASNPHKGVSESRDLFWRPYNGDVEKYIDPTRGAQDTREYWLR